MTFDVTIAGMAAEEVYLDLAGVKQRIAGMIGKGAAAYRALVADSDDQKRLLTAATRFIDEQGWQGVALLAAAADPTTLQFPRSGLKIKGVDIAEADQLALVQKAFCEIVAVFAAQASAAATADTSQNIRAIGAGTARVEFFSPTSIARGTATKLPTPAQNLIGMWLAAGGGAVVVSVGGSSAPSTCSNFPLDYGVKRRDPF